MTGPFTHKGKQVPANGDGVKPLPRGLRPDVLIKTPLACRFGWHHMNWGEAGSITQSGICARCGKAKERYII